MSLTKLIIILAIIGGCIYGAKKMGYIGQGQKAVQESFEAYHQKGNGLYIQDKYEEAIKALEHALALDANHKAAPECMARIGDCYRDWAKANHDDKEKLMKAIEYYEKTAATYPESDMAGKVKQSAEKTRSLGSW